MQTATETTVTNAVALLTMFLFMFDELTATFSDELDRITGEINKWVYAPEQKGVRGGYDHSARQSPAWADMCALQESVSARALSKGLDLDAIPEAIRACVTASNPVGLAAVWYGDEDGGPSTQVFTAQDIARYMYLPTMCVQNLDEFLPFAKELVDANGVVTRDMARKWINELEDGQLTTVEELEAQEKEKEFRALERLAKQVASTCEGGMGTVAFIERVYALIDREEDNRYGLEEDGLCACSTMNREDAVNEWYDMRNESHGRTATYHDLLDWFQRECPLIWAQWTESQLAKEAKA
jgi:hypothetical protein